jgi:hypothetical protein
LTIKIKDPSSSYDEETESIVQADGARPSTSRGFRGDEEPSSSDEKSKLIKQKSADEEKESELKRKLNLIVKKLMMIPTFISSVLVSVTLRLHRISRSYRYVMRVLAREKKTLKVFLL